MMSALERNSELAHRRRRSAPAVFSLPLSLSRPQDKQIKKDDATDYSVTQQ